MQAGFAAGGDLQSEAPREPLRAPAASPGKEGLTQTFLLLESWLWLLEARQSYEAEQKKLFVSTRKALLDFQERERHIEVHIQDVDPSSHRSQRTIGPLVMQTKSLQ